MKRCFSILILGLLCAFGAKAQFYTTGSDSPRVKWMHIKTEHFDVIYPCGQDSLARVYALKLESIAPAHAKRVPVLLRNRLSYSNGMVTLPPLRMELYTIPDAYDPLATPWSDHLVIHESDHLRRVTDLSWKFPWKPLGWLFGGLGHGAGLIFTTELSLLEGSAVIAETEGTLSGRGRTADFLEYYRVATGSGQRRNFYQWRYGSISRYTPDYYRAGYIAMSGDNYRFRGLPGRKFAAGFSRNLNPLSTYWRQDEEKRGPFAEPELLTPLPRYYQEYTSPIRWQGQLYAIRSGETVLPAIVRIGDDGTVSSVQLLSASHSRLSASEEFIFWSENVQDLRWNYLSYSDIFRLDSLGHKQRLTVGQRYYNPSVAPDGRRLSVSSYAEDAASSVVVLDAESGDVLNSYKLPSGMQVVQTVWVGDELYASVLGKGGFCIYSVPDFTQVLPEEPVKIKDLWSSDGNILFTCDRTGVNELYELNLPGGEVFQRTVSRYGASDFCIDGDGRMVLSTPLPEGRLLALSDDRSRRRVDYSVLSEYPLASRREETDVKSLDMASEEDLPEPRRYRRFPFIPHSWAPFYVNYDSIDAMSLYSQSSNAALGATMFYQNPLGNIYGSAAIHPFCDSSGAWKVAGEFNFTTTALFPVIEAKLKVNAHPSIYYALGTDKENHLFFYAGQGQKLNTNLYLRAYVPFNFSRGGLNIGLIPSISANISNGALYSADEEKNPVKKIGGMARMHSSVRAYCIQGIPKSRIYPKLGIGAEIGGALRPAVVNEFCPVAYASLYGYLPGLGERDGFRLRGIYESSLGNAVLSETYANTLPRGLSSFMAGIAAGYRHRVLLSVDYALPFASLDWGGLSPLAYLRNLEIVPHFDCGLYSGKRGREYLTSAGAELCLRLGNFFWVPLDTRVGVRYDYNTGSLLGDDPNPASRHSVAVIFSVDL